MSVFIKNIDAQYILDSRGYPTIEATAYLSNGFFAKASVPSGASTGEREALELRDIESKQWNHKGVAKAIDNIHHKINPLLKGASPYNIEKIDTLLIEGDGTTNKSQYGANAILATSLAVLHAAAKSNNKQLFEYLLKNKNYIMPIPMMNILNGGSHANNNVDIQEFMIMPHNFTSYSDALRAGVEVFHKLKEILVNKNYNTAVGDEGGFAPSLRENEEALELILEAIVKSGYNSDSDISLALDVAASELYSEKEKKYNLSSENKKMTQNELIEYYKILISKYPIISIEDGLDQNDWEGWSNLTTTLGNKVQIVGDDLTTTNTSLLQKAINNKSINAILIKLNQIGTFSETMQAIYLAKKNNLGIIISHRSGETEDTTIADLAVATSCGQIKTGAPSRTDRTAKYNRLLRIEKYLKNNTAYATKDYLGCEEKRKKY